MILALISKCSDPTMVPILSVIKKVFLMIQIIGPILAIVSLTILMFRLMLNPVDPQDKIKHGIRNSIIALVVLFLIPLFVNITMALLGDTFSVSACWNVADNYKMSSGNYKSTNDKNKTKIIGSSKYDSGGTGVKNKSSTSSAADDTDYDSIDSENMADAFVKLALAQKSSSSAKGGQKYWSYMGFSSHIQWCACFVGWTIGHTEYNGEKMTKYMGKGQGNCKSILNTCKSSKTCKYYDQGQGYTPKRGDIIFYTWNNRQSVGHVGIVQYVKNGRVKTIEGNCGDVICEQNMTVTDKRIYGYAAWS